MFAQIVAETTSHLENLLQLLLLFLAHVVLRENWTLLYQFLSLSFCRQLCLLLNAEDIYRALSEIIVQEEDLLFASLMVRYLNMILLTSSELFDLRDQLRELATPVSNS